MTSACDYNDVCIPHFSTSHAEIRRVPDLGLPVADLLDAYDQLFLRHIEICFIPRKQNEYHDYPPQDAVTHFLDNLRALSLEILEDIGLGDQGKIHFWLLPSRSATKKTVLQYLLIMSQEAFLGLGNFEQSAAEVLDELITDSWEDVQKSSLLNPDWLSSAIHGVGSVYLSGDQSAQGAQALSAMVEYCHAQRTIGW